jgi:hypothetical protein
MSYTIGSYVHVTSKEKTSDNESKVIQGTIVNIRDDGAIIIDTGLAVLPELYDIIVFDNVQSISQAEKLARAEAMRNHPAGKGRR